MSGRPSAASRRPSSSSSSSSAAAAAIAPPEKSVQERLVLDRLGVVDTETDRLLDLFSGLINAAGVPDRKTRSEREALQTAVNASQLVQSCERLLGLVGDLKRDIVLHDHQRYLHRYVKKQRKEYVAQHEAFLRSPEHAQWKALVDGTLQVQTVGENGNAVVSTDEQDDATMRDEGEV